MMSIDGTAILFNQDLIKKKSDKYELNYSENMAQYASSLESTSSLSDDASNESVSLETITVFYRDHRHQVKIDANLAAIDFCNLMAIKLGLNSNLAWYLSLELPFQKMKSILEDWEEVLIVFKRFSNFNCRLVLRHEDEEKRFEFFEKWRNCFVSEMISFEGEEKEKKRRGMGFCSRKCSIKLNDIQTQLSCFDKLRIIVTSRLNVSSSTRTKAALVEATFNTESCVLTCVEPESGHKSIFHVNRYQFFRPMLEQQGENCQYSFYFILDKDDDDFVNPSDELKLFDKDDPNQIITFTANSENERKCWLTVLKLSKYGLGDYRWSYHEFRKHKEANNSGNNGNTTAIGSGYVDMEKGLVLLDYSSKDGPKIIDDHKEMLTLVDSESNKCSPELCATKISRSKSNLSSSSSPSSPETSTPKSSTVCYPSRYFFNSLNNKGICFLGSNNSGSMLTSTQTTTTTTPSNSTTTTATQQSHLKIAQPWFYANMTRDEAIKLLTKYETIDGVFLVRSSSRNPLSYVLSFVHNHRIMHYQIRQIEFENAVCLSLDYGNTKFYDLQQLIEFYQLNSTCLPTKLTHFLVHKPSSCASGEP